MVNLCAPVAPKVVISYFFGNTDSNNRYLPKMTSEIEDELWNYYFNEVRFRLTLKKKKYRFSPLFSIDDLNRVSSYFFPLVRRIYSDLRIACKDK